MGYNTYNTLYNSNIIPIANYASGVWGFKEHHEVKKSISKPNGEVLSGHTQIYPIGCNMHGNGLA